MDQNLQTSSAVPVPEEIQPKPSINDGLRDIESGNPMSGNPQQGVPYFAGNPSQVVPREAPTSGCNGPCCIPLQTACLVIGILGIILPHGIYPPSVVIALGVESKSIDYITTFFIILFVLFIINVILIVGSKKKLFVLVIIYIIATGIYVLAFLIVLSIAFLHRPEIYYYYLYMLIYIYFLVVAGFYGKELKTGQIQRQGQVYMQQGQGQVYMQQGQGLVLGTLGQNQISRSPSQANGQSGQVIGSPVLAVGSPGEAVGSPGQGQQYGQSY